MNGLDFSRNFFLLRILHLNVSLNSWKFDHDNLWNFQCEYVCEMCSPKQKGKREKELSFVEYFPNARSSCWVFSHAFSLHSSCEIEHFNLHSLQIRKLSPPAGKWQMQNSYPSLPLKPVPILLCHTRHIIPTMCLAHPEKGFLTSPRVLVLEGPQRWSSLAQVFPPGRWSDFLKMRVPAIYQVRI